jgi:hypothetical protein
VPPHTSRSIAERERESHAAETKLGTTFRRYVGGWTEEHLKADVDAQTAAAHSCYTVAAIWMGFLALSFVCCFANYSKPSSAPRVRY